LKLIQEKDKERNQIPDSLWSLDFLSIINRTKLCDVELIVDDAMSNGSTKYYSHYSILYTQSNILQMVFSHIIIILMR
jgi:hypothetical protein